MSPGLYRNIIGDTGRPKARKKTLKGSQMEPEIPQNSDKQISLGMPGCPLAYFSRKNVSKKLPTPPHHPKQQKQKHKLSTQTEQKTRQDYRFIFCDKVRQQCAPNNSSKIHPPHGPHTLKNKHGSRQKRKIKTEWQMLALQGNGGSPLL